MNQDDPLTTQVYESWNHTLLGLIDLGKVAGFVGFYLFDWSFALFIATMYGASAMVKMAISDLIDQRTLAEINQRALPHEDSGRYLQLREWNGHIDP